MSTGDVVIADIEEVIKGDVPAWFTDAMGAGLAVGPKLFTFLASVDTDPLIALPYITRILALLGTLFADLAAHKPEADAMTAFDSAVADIIEELRFGAGVP